MCAYKISEDDHVKEAAEEYHKEHPIDWSEHKYAKTISLEKLTSIFRKVPIVYTHEDEIVFQSGSHEIPLKLETVTNQLDSLIKWLVDHVPYKEIDFCKVFAIMDVINSVEKERASEPDFPFVLDEGFVEHHKKRNEGLISAEERITQYDQIMEENKWLRVKLLESETSIDKKSFFQSLATEIKKDADGKIDLDIPLVIEAIAHLLVIKVSKLDKIYNPNGKERRGYSYDSIKNCISDVFPKGIQGNVNKDERFDKEKKLASLLNMLSKPKYNQFIEDFNKLK